MKKILFLTQSLFPPANGGAQAVYYRILAMSKYYHTYTIMLDMVEGQSSSKEKSYNEFVENNIHLYIIKPYCESITRSNSFFIKIKQIALWLLSNKPRKFQILQSSKLKKKVTEYILSNKIDVVFLERTHTAELIDINLLKKHDIKMICVTHDVEHHHIEQSIGELYPGNSWFKKIMQFEINRVKKCEYSIYNSVNQVIGISNVDVDYIRKDANINKIDYCPCILPLPTHKWYSNKSNYILFPGSMSYYSNYHGVKWFLENVFSKYIEIMPDISLLITGKVDVKIISEFQKYENVHFTGFLSSEEFYSILLNCVFVIVPIKKGTGIKIKLLEAMSYGIPIITVPESVTGIPVSTDDKKKPFIVANDSQEFLDKMISLTKDDVLRSQIGLYARKYFEKNYTDENIHKWINIVDHVIKG